ncbi:SAR2788 family putative toxin [Viridibacillus arvi]|uniref:SAR2788 family putative toxin n=1 Tax=Viridibacillus arvi TaxID=263475 RepID=UPI003D2A8096
MKSLMAIMVFSSIAPHFASAETLNFDNDKIESNFSELTKEGIQYHEKITNNEAIITTSLKTEDLESTSDLEIDLNSNEIVLNTVLDDEQGNTITNSFEVHMLDFQGEDFKAIFIEKTTGEEYYINTGELQASIVPLVVVLATVARYGITRAIAKHSASQVTKAMVGNVAKTKIPTDTIATQVAKELGYEFAGLSPSSHKTKVFKKTAKDAVDGPKFITRDIDSHIGGVWKGGKKLEDVASKEKRSGTYDAVLKRIGD